MKAKPRFVEGAVYFHPSLLGCIREFVDDIFGGRQVDSGLFATGVVTWTSRNP